MSHKTRAPPCISCIFGEIQRRELRNKRVYTSSIRKASHGQPGNIHLLINLYLRNLVLFRVSLDDTLAIELPQF